VLSEVVEVLLRDGRIAFALALSAIFIAALIDFRSLRSAILACLPLVVGLLWTFGVMSLIELKLNLFNFVILPALLGIGIDYGVHYVHRYHGEGRGNLGRVMRALYWVIFFCAATTIVGFGNMALADHPGLKSLGQLAIIGLACMFFASTYTLPAVLFVLERIRGVPAEPEVEAPRVTIFATTYCPSCRLVRRLLSDHGIVFAYVELDALAPGDRERLAGEIVGATGADALPVTRVGKQYVVGFNPDELLHAVGNNKNEKAAAGPERARTGERG
jgi:glutaredoxin